MITFQLSPLSFFTLYDDIFHNTHWNEYGCTL